MPIDWFTVFAQIINFLILVWLLKMFLFKPILDAIDDREKRIATQLALAATKTAEAERQRDDFQKKNQSFDLQSACQLKAATDAAGVERQRLLDAARKEADLLIAKRQVALRNEQQQLSDQITRWTQQEVFEIARKMLSDLADANLEQRIGEVFVKRLRSISKTEKEQLVAAVKSSPDPVTVRSAFELPQTIRDEIQSAIKDLCDTEPRFEFDNAPAVVSGVELVANGQKVAWSVAGYLTNLEQNVNELLKTNPEVAAAPRLEVQPDSVPQTASRTRPVPERSQPPELATLAAKGVQ